MPSKRSSVLKRRGFDSPTVQFLYDRYVGDDVQKHDDYEAEVLHSEIARTIYDLRTKAGLSQRELAKRVGTSASAICRIEDADYDGHSLSLLKRIADALGRRVEVRFLPVKRLRSASLNLSFRALDCQHGTGCFSDFRVGFAATGELGQYMGVEQVSGHRSTGCG